MIEFEMAGLKLLEFKLLEFELYKIGLPLNKFFEFESKNLI